MNKISVIFRGGVGNQLFTYLASEIISKKLNIKNKEYFFYGDFNLDLIEDTFNLDRLVNLKIKKIKIKSKILKYISVSIKNFFVFMFLIKLILEI